MRPHPNLAYARPCAKHFTCNISSDPSSVYSALEIGIIVYVLMMRKMEMRKGEVICPRLQGWGTAGVVFQFYLIPNPYPSTTPHPLLFPLRFPECPTFATLNSSFFTSSPNIRASLLWLSCCAPQGASWCPALC